MSTVFDQMLSRYAIKSDQDKRNANQEVMQHITLSALNRSGFFDNAAFYGGTCLRIFYSIPRFSEDMDFSLLKKDRNFTLDKYFDSIINEFKLYGREVSIQKKTGKPEKQIESAFLKDNTEILNIEFQTERSIKIKLEVDKDPPLNFKTEFKLLLLPYSFMTRCFTLPGLFAGKMHALLFRGWKNRVKGRDWYDFEWYVRNSTPIDFEHLRERSLQSGYLGKNEFTREVCIELLRKRVETANINQIKDDVRAFLKNPQELEIWSTGYFLQLAGMIRFE
jgi:predicted nucleotidyltransferase component of viral defense system